MKALVLLAVCAKCGKIDEMAIRRNELPSRLLESRGWTVGPVFADSGEETGDRPICVHCRTEGRDES